jgi:hypothetical protein
MTLFSVVFYVASAGGQYMSNTLLPSGKIFAAKDDWPTCTPSFLAADFFMLNFPKAEMYGDVPSTSICALQVHLQSNEKRLLAPSYLSIILHGTAELPPGVFL